MQFECATVFHDIFLVPLLIYGSETMIWKEMNDLRSLLAIRRMDKVLNTRIRELYGVTKGLRKVSSGRSAM